MDTKVETLARLTGKNRPITADQFISDARLLAEMVNGKWPGQFDAIVAVARGGLMPALVVARELGIRDVETFCIVSYNDFGLMDESKIIAPPSARLRENSSRVLIVDDLTDSGRTAQVTRPYLPDAKFVTVYGKEAGLSHIDLHAVEVEQDVWLHFPWDIEHGRRPPIVGPDS